VEGRKSIREFQGEIRGMEGEEQQRGSWVGGDDDADRYHERLERLERGRMKRGKWGKQTGNTLKRCPRCFLSKHAQGFVEMEDLSYSLKKKGRWKVVEHLKPFEVC